MLKRFLTKTILGAAVITCCTIAAHAATIQIGNIITDTTPPCTSSCDGQLFGQNLTNIDMNYVLSGLFPLTGTIGPGATLDVVGYGGFSPTDVFSLSGTLSSLDFTVGGTAYHAASLNWASPSISVGTSNSLPITITATAVATATPEPAGLLMCGIGLLVVGIRRLTH